MPPGLSTPHSSELALSTPARGPRRRYRGSASLLSGPAPRPCCFPCNLRPAGERRLLRSDLVMDVGRSLNPAVDIGQVRPAVKAGVCADRARSIHSPVQLWIEGEAGMAGGWGDAQYLLSCRC